VLYPKPLPNSVGRYETSFFCHGLRYVDQAATARIGTMNVGDPLFPMYDIRNPADTDAVAIRSNDPSMLLGYVPRPLARDVRACIDQVPLSRVDFRVRRVNLEAPLQFRLLCRLETDWPSNFAPCSDEEYQPRAKSTPPTALEVA
jgi:HIRAN domain